MNLSLLPNRRDGRCSATTSVGRLPLTWALIALQLMLSPLLAGAPRKLLPVDEAANDSAFFLFRARLQEAVARRDTKQLLSVVAPEVQNGFGGDDGAAAFRRIWELDDGGRNSALWAVLGHVLALGGRFMEDGVFQAPYASAAWPEDLDPYEYAAVIGEQVRVRDRPDASAKVVDTVSYEILRLMPLENHVEGNPWVRVELADGRMGFIHGDYLDGAVSHRAYFQKRNGTWKLTALVAGD